MIYVKYPRVLTWGLVLTTMLVILAAGCSRRETEAVVTRRDIVAYLPLDGEVAAPAAADAGIVPPYDASVDRIYVTVGQSVRRGDVLMELAAPQTQAYYQESRQRLLQAREQLAQAERRYNSEVQVARRNLDQARQAERAARQVAQAPEVTTGQVRIIEVPNVALARAEEERRAAEQTLIDAEARREVNLAPYQQRLVAAEQNFQDAQQGRRAAMVRSPISGTVLEINTAIGQEVSRDQRAPVARIVDLAALKVHASVSEQNLREIDRGDPATVTVNQLPGEEFQGLVQQIYSERAGFLRGAQHVAVVDFVNREGLVKPAMTARASVKVGEVNNVLAVPASAVYMRGDQHAIRLRVGEEWHERIVEIGLSDGRYTEIKSGLQEGDVVLANP